METVVKQGGQGIKRVALGIRVWLRYEIWAIAHVWEQLVHTISPLGKPNTPLPLVQKGKFEQSEATIIIGLGWQQRPNSTVLNIWKFLT